jgi:hypothetical protein
MASKYFDDSLLPDHNSTHHLLNIRQMLHHLANLLVKTVMDFHYFGRPKDGSNMLKLNASMKVQ